MHPTIKAHDNLCFPPWRAYLLFLSYTSCKSHSDLHLSFLHFILWQAQCVGKIQVYIANWMWVFMNYYCWHYPWGKTLGGKTISPYLSLCPIKTPYHKYCVSVSNCERLYDSWVCGLAEKLLYWLFPMLW